MASIIRKSGLTSEQIVELAKNKPFRITHPDERILAAMLIKFHDVLNDSVDELAINKITDFIYDICAINWTQTVKSKLFRSLHLFLE